jgi:hypothetical protein
VSPTSSIGAGYVVYNTGSREMSYTSTSQLYVNTTTTNALHYPVFVNSTSGTPAPFVDSGFNINPSNDALSTSGTFTAGDRILANGGISVAGQNITSSGSPLYNADGAFYRYDGQAYITTDDNLYISGPTTTTPNTTIQFRFSNGVFTIGGTAGVTAAGGISCGTSSSSFQINRGCLKQAANLPSSWRYVEDGITNNWGNVSLDSTPSDERIKTDIQDLDPVEFLHNIYERFEPKRFKIRPEFPNMNYNKINHDESGDIGFIAQDIEKIAPELIVQTPMSFETCNFDDFRTYNLKYFQLYNSVGICGLLQEIKRLETSHQQLDTKVSSLTEKVHQLETIIDSLIERITFLENRV